MYLINLGVNTLDKHLTTIVQYYNVKYLGDRLRPAIVRGQIAGIERAISLACNVLAISTVALAAIGSLAPIPALLLWGTFAITGHVAFIAFDQKAIDTQKLLNENTYLGAFLRSSKAMILMLIRERS